MFLVQASGKVVHKSIWCTPFCTELASNLEIFNFELTAHPNAKDVESLQFLVFKYIFLKSQSIVCLLAHDGSAGFSLGFKISDDIDVYFQLLHLL